ncbi:MAG TPA: hypothetical protein VGG29_15980 [Caulobacteraceae bacterium]|jgi:hypothetical protein
MNTRSTNVVEFDALRPRLLALLEQHRTASSEEARAQLVGRLEEVFLATAWHVARDMLENGWLPGYVAPPPPPASPPPRPSTKTDGEAAVSLVSPRRF